MVRSGMKYGLVVVLAACGGDGDSNATGSEGGDSLNGACATPAALRARRLRN